MADSKISALPASTTPLAGTEVLPIVQSSTTKQVSVANLTAGRAISAASVTASTGNFVVGTSGQGIDFSATPGTGTSELLADYEEGTWNPTITFGGASVGVVYGGGGAKYTLIGNLVTCTAYLTLINKGSSTGNVAIGGLPFTTAAGTNYSYGGVGTSDVIFSGNIFALIYPATTTAVIYQSTLLGVRSIVQNTAVSNTSEFSIQFSYQV
jgi:hypothetical protein